MRRLLILFLLPMISGCSSSEKQNKEKEQELQARIFKIHDRLMPQMEMIINKKQLFSQKIHEINTIKKAHPQVDTAALAARLSLAVNHLESADHGMMDWMHKLDMNFENKSHAQIMGYLDEQYKKIQHVDSGMRATFKESDLLSKEIQ